MANVCFDSVVFYTGKNNNLDSIRQMAEALRHCYPVINSHTKTGMEILLNYLGLSIQNYNLRGSIIRIDIMEDYIRLDIEAAWSPLYGAYQALSHHYNLPFVLLAEEPSFDIFINTDVCGIYFDTRYRVLLDLEEGAAGTPYETLFKGQEDSDIYFSSEKELLSWFGEYGFQAADLEALECLLDDNYVRISTFDISYD